MRAEHWARVLGLAAALLLATADLAFSQWHKSYCDAIEALREERFQEALRLLQRAQKEGPNPGLRIRITGWRLGSFFPYVHLARAHDGLGNAREALAHYRKSKELEDLSGEMELAQLRGTRIAELMANLEPKPDPNQPTPSFGTYHALLIGVDDYGDARLPDLDRPVRDARELEFVLRERYTFDHIELLTNPTHAEIINKLEALRGLSARDNLLLFYAGHGRWDEKAEQGYWLPSDAAFDKPANWISNSTVRDSIRAMDAKHVLLISDACFSGSIFQKERGVRDVPRRENEMYRRPSRRAMTSGVNETVPDKSVFLEYLVRRLEENDRLYLHAQMLFVNMQEAILNNSRQSPQYGVIHDAEDAGGDFIFVRRSPEAGRGGQAQNLRTIESENVRMREE